MPEKKGHSKIALILENPNEVLDEHFIKTLLKKVQIQKANSLYRVISQAVIRTIPKRSGKIVRRESKGRSLRVTGILPTGWLQVSEEGEAIGWVHKSLVAKAESPAKRQARIEIPSPPPSPKQGEWRSSGSGFYIKKSRHILTNHHVIEKASTIRVSFPSGASYRGRVVAVDKRNDLAVVELQKMRPKREGFGFRFGVRVKIGERIHALGYPLGTRLSRKPSMVSGEISATTGMGDNLSQFRTTAPINAGNSGGPIVNDKGELVGVAVAGLVQRGVEGVRFGIKATAAALILEQVPALEGFSVQVRARKRKPSPSQIFRELSPYVVMIEVR